MAGCRSVGRSVGRWVADRRLTDPRLLPSQGFVNLIAEYGMTICGRRPIEVRQIADSPRVFVFSHYKQSPHITMHTSSFRRSTHPVTPDHPPSPPIATSSSCESYWPVPTAPRTTPNSSDTKHPTKSCPPPTTALATAPSPPSRTSRWGGHPYLAQPHRTPW